MDIQQIQKNVIDIFDLYEKYGQSDYIGEPVSQLDHMIQTAQLALEDGYGDEVILAAFFHDIGHLCEFIMHVSQMYDVGVADHEKIGGAYLRGKGFSEKIKQLVESHVQAKRYLALRKPAYYLNLSPASKITLNHQGGIMTETEAKLFENDPLLSLYIKLREWDDKAKEVNKSYESLDNFKQLSIRHLLQQ